MSTHTTQFGEDEETNVTGNRWVDLAVFWLREAAEEWPGSKLADNLTLVVAELIRLEAHRAPRTEDSETTGGKMEINEFHESDGWMFKRIPEDGRVRIRNEALGVEHFISANAWQSVVDFVALKPLPHISHASGNVICWCGERHLEPV